MIGLPRLTLMWFLLESPDANMAPMWEMQVLDKKCPPFCEWTDDIVITINPYPTCSVGVAMGRLSAYFEFLTWMTQLKTNTR